MKQEILTKTERNKAKKSLKELRMVLKFMEGALSSNNENKASMACAFLHIVEHHLNFGDLSADNLHLATLLRLQNVVDRCQHESDGIIYTSNPPQNKCVKCGELYK